jgi:RNA polymerase sigma factor (sigma-70 family)
MMTITQLRPSPNQPVADAELADETGSCFADADADTEGGDEPAWELLVRRYEPYLLRLAASYRLGEETYDAVQNTFLRLLQHGGEIRQPESVKYWLAAVLRRECLKVIARRRREQPCDTVDDHLPPAAHGEVDAGLLREEDVAYVRSALAALPDRQRQVLLMLSGDDNEGYRRLGERLSIPVGSIGPTRQRALARLRHELTQCGY